MSGPKTNRTFSFEAADVSSVSWAHLKVSGKVLGLEFRVKPSELANTREAKR